MADTKQFPILSVCATVGSRLSQLPIKNGQLIFVQDRHWLALDYNGKRKFYNQIEELPTDADRVAILAPLSGCYYFVIDTAVLWTYNNRWIQITTSPEEVVFIGTELPELGSNRTRLYVNTANGTISVWDDGIGDYLVVANKSIEMSAEELSALFNETTNETT